ncbi:MAG: tRNA (N6-isopentenyl adenosine(37)-C2)-methylthiotransferase MiaB [Deltaproteobacteria bacterium]|nr:tRNA (N6-isopentenyl adenosine(37)-C2)-methylthiotransferase MiaB [Deltaproteobacteria bacterium]
MPLPILPAHVDNEPAGCALPAPARPRPARRLSADSHPHGVFIETFGCQMNAHDTERLQELLEPLGYRAVDRQEEADLVILNSCDIREKAEHKLMSALGRLKDLKRERRDLVVAVAGCVAQVEGDKLLRRAPHVDIVVGTDQLRAVPDMVRAARAGSGPQVNNAPWDPGDGLDADTAFVGAMEGAQPTGVTAFVTAMTGCDKKCAYCIVPFTRGRERSRPLPSILAEVEMLVGKGIREVMLIGQTVNTWGMDFAPGGPDFADLLRAVHDVPGLQRVRFMTSHPRDMTDRLVAALGALPRVAAHLHLPVQAGSDAVLARMGRGYTRAYYLERVAALRRARPELSITSDIIVGFPGETEADFAATMALLDEVRFDNLFSFAFSERPGTAAADLPDPVPPDVRRARLNILQARQRQFTREFLDRQRDTHVEVLVEGPSRNDGGVLCGKTGQNVTVNFTGQAGAGDLVRIRVDEVRGNTFFGALAGAA